MRIGKKQPNPSIRYGPEMKILIVGGGISGLTLGALLQQRGFIPTIVEKIPEYGDVGYVIVLWPSGSKILKGLNLYRKFEEIGHECTKYDVANEKGETLNIFSNDEVREEYGPIISTYRPEMINLLREAVNPDFIRMNTTVENIRQDKNCVYVTFTDGSQGSYDLVVGCDGIRSRTRQLVFGDVPLRYSGMSGWGFWIKSKFLKVGQISEYWGTGKFFGIWPTKGRLSVFTSIRSPNNVPDPLESRINRIKSNFKEFGGMVPEILENLDNPEEIYHDDYHDIKMEKWYKGRVVLIGDAAHAILPTAGGGVAMAMESAAVICEELCRTDSQHITQSLNQFMARRRARVNKIQNQSRMVGEFAFANSIIVSKLRNIAMRFYPKALFVRSFKEILKENI